MSLWKCSVGKCVVILVIGLFCALKSKFYLIEYSRQGVPKWQMMYTKDSFIGATAKRKYFHLYVAEAQQYDWEDYPCIYRVDQAGS